MKKAYYSDFIWYNSKGYEKHWLLVDRDLVTGCVKQPPEDYSKVTFSNSSIFPAFINTHSHAPMAFLRGIADDLPLMEWLRHNIWPVEKKLVTEEFVADATILAVAEMIKGGTCCVNDMYFFSEKSAEIYDEVGFRTVIGCGLMENPNAYHDDFLINVKHMIDKFKESHFVDVSLCPHALYSVEKSTFEKIVDFARNNDVIVHTHLAESQWEYDEVMSKHGLTPLQFVEKLGMLDECRSIFAHCIYLNSYDIEIMGKKQANVSHCIQSNLKLASGVAPVVELIKAGANVSIGTDSAASNNDVDMISEMNTVALVHKGFYRDATVMDAKTVLECATVNGAVALGLDKCGALKKGNYADFIVLSHNEPHMQPNFNPLSLLVYSANQGDITDMFIAGKQLMKNKKLTTIDEDKLRENSAKWKSRIRKTLN